MRLTTKIHDRDNAGLTYVYPVVSRRARGVSLGINLNPNNACNFRCVYCQVPGLTFGKAPETDLLVLENELRDFLTELVNGDYMEKHVPEGSRVLRDVALSGNGEPTSSEQFLGAIQVVGRVLAEFSLLGKVKLILITNGSLIHQAPVQEALALMKPMGGEVWFKLDSATEAGQARINNFTGGLERIRTNLTIAAQLCPTWVQTCVFDWQDSGPSQEEKTAYLDFLAWAQKEGLQLLGVLLYGLARQSHQPEARELSALPIEWLEGFAHEIEQRGLAVRVNA